MGYTEQNRLEDFNWFLDNYDDLYREHGVCHIVIQNKHVLGIYNNFGNAIRETEKTIEPGAFIVQLCNGDESGYTNYIASNEVGVI